MIYVAAKELQWLRCGHATSPSCHSSHLLLLRCSMSYPSVFCVKCKSHTDTLGRHTIQLSNNRRALKGVCPVCATETYRFMPEKGNRETQLSLISSQKRLSSKNDRPKSALIARFKPETQGVTRVDLMSYGMGDKYLHYGILLILFGMSAVIGYILCAELFFK